jgi:hypothetical protein
MGIMLDYVSAEGLDKKPSRGLGAPGEERPACPWDLPVTPAPISYADTLENAQRTTKAIDKAHQERLALTQRPVITTGDDWDYWRAPVALPRVHITRLPKPSTDALEAGMRTRKALIEDYQSGNGSEDREHRWAAVQDTVAHVGDVPALARQLEVGPLLRERGVTIKEVAKKAGVTTAKMTAALEANGYVAMVPYGGRQRRAMASEATIEAGYGTNVHLKTRHGPSVMPVFYRDHVEGILWTLEPDLKAAEREPSVTKKALAVIDQMPAIGLPYMAEALVAELSGVRPDNLTRDPAYVDDLSSRGVQRTGGRGRGGVRLTFPEIVGD